MTMIIDGTNGLTFNNGTTQASAGQVLQVVMTTTNDTSAINNTSFASMGVSLSITPKSSSSKVLVMVLGGAVVTNDPARFYNETIYRNSTNLSTNSSGSLGNYGATSSELVTPHSTVFLDSPATTSSTTYTIYGKRTGNAVYFNTGATVTFIAMEIAS